VNCAVEAPLATVTEEGTVSLALLEVSETEVADEALAERVTVQEVEPAPVIEVGLQARPEMVVGGLTVSWAVAAPPRVAVRVAGVEEATVPAVAVKLAVVEFWATVTLAGTVTELEEELNATAEPPEGAAVERVTMQAD
jgi:hypothetical protein